MMFYLCRMVIKMLSWEGPEMYLFFVLSRSLETVAATRLFSQK
jgi:hypothetical protein